MDTPFYLFGIIRPDASGNWFLQNDVDHAPQGLASVTQDSEKLVLNFTRGYTHAGALLITSDDDFNVRVQGHNNLGLTGANIRIYLNGVMIDPADVYTLSGITPGSGNLWVFGAMIDRT